MCKSKYQVLYTYLLTAFVALIAVANHFNFQARPTADALLTDTPASVIEEINSVKPTSTPIIADRYTAKAAQTTTQSAKSSTPVNFAAERVSTPAVDAGSSVKIYRNMLYAHSHRAGQAFKKLSVGSVFTATIDGQTTTYRVISRQIYSKTALNSDSALRASIYGYKDGLSLMTCGNGTNNDENYRLVLLAARI